MEEPVYYAEWEQEYAEGGTLLGGQPAFQGPPFPSPTPYGQAGMTYSFGRRVEIAPLHVLVTAKPDVAVGIEQQRYLIELTWTNPTEQEIPINYETQLWLRSIARPDGTLQSGDGWGISREEAAQLSLDIPTQIAPGESHLVLPVLAPPGQPKTVELRLPILNGSLEQTMATPVGATPAPNSELRDPARRWLVVEWVDAAPVGPPCDDPGALTDWDSGVDRKAIPRNAAVDLHAPPGAPRVVELALEQVGKTYIWGHEGPDTFDCSGLMYWSYAQIGIRIPRTTSTQWPSMAPVSLGAAQPGDLVFMDTSDGFSGAPRKVTHVGMLADLNGDGRWDMIHAANPEDGVRIEYDVFHSRYYGLRLFDEARTAR
jgi:hypothetical protein